MGENLNQEEVGTLRSFAPQYFAWLDKETVDATNTDVQYAQAYDIVRAVKRKRTLNSVFRLLFDDYKLPWEPRRLLQDDFFRHTADGQAYYAKLDELIAIKKAGAAVAAWLVGFEVASLSLDEADEQWLREPHLQKGEATDYTVAYWAAVCASVGLRSAMEALNDPDDEERYDQVFSCNDVYWSFVGILEEVWELDNFGDFCMAFTSLVRDVVYLKVVTTPLLARRVLDGSDFARIMLENGILLGDLSVYEAYGFKRLIPLDATPDYSIGAEQARLELQNSEIVSRVYFLRKNVKRLQ